VIPELKDRSWLPQTLTIASCIFAYVLTAEVDASTMRNVIKLLDVLTGFLLVVVLGLAVWGLLFR
jgi:hypothetical protein